MREKKKEIVVKIETHFEQIKVLIIFIICDPLRFNCIDT